MATVAKTYQDEFRAVFAAKCHYYGLTTRAKQEKALGIKGETLADYLRDPGMFRQRHLMRVYAVLHFSAAERDLLNHSGKYETNGTVA